MGNWLRASDLFPEKSMGDPRGQEEVPADQLKMGKEVEKEHASTVAKIKASLKDGQITMTNEEIYASIAADHLYEFSNYYTLLKEMEDKAKSIKKQSWLKTGH